MPATENYLHDGQMHKQAIVTLAQVHSFVSDVLGLVPEQVREVHIRHAASRLAVTATVYHNNPNKNRVVSDDGQGCLVYDIEFPVAGV
jgi:hypothetical protein